MRVRAARDRLLQPLRAHPLRRALSHAAPRSGGSLRQRPRPLRAGDPARRRPHCEGCRADIGNYALDQINNAPRAPLPDHWLDRAIALSGDQTRSEAEKLQDADLPSSLTAKDVAAEFLRRIERPAQERVPVSPPSILRNPEYREGWSVDCRRTEYTVTGPGAGRYPLPCLVSTDGDLLGPALEEGDKPGQTWWIVPETEIELPLLVTGRRAAARAQRLHAASERADLLGATRPAHRGDGRCAAARRSRRDRLGQPGARAGRGGRGRDRRLRRRPGCTSTASP